ncbi:MAG: AAA family ATPase [Bacteroidia bacterium]|nr:AAA family ATPase [Bacteroidia bacterium]
MMLERYDKLLEAIECERTEEEKYYRSLAADKSIKEKMEAGILWYPVIMTKHFYTVGEYLEIQFEKTRNTNVPHKLKTGMGCRIYKDLGHKQEFDFKGTISFIRKNKISVILRDNVVTKDDLANMNTNLCIELVHDERPFKVMKAAIQDLIKTEKPHLVKLRNGVAEKSAFQTKPSDPFVHQPTHLNESQNNALKNICYSDQMSIIHGPPGTGKTTTLVALIKEIAKSEKKILVCAPSNNAVDLLATQLDAIGLSVLRIGNVSRISDNLTHLTLAEKARNDDEWQHIKRVKIEAEVAKNQAGKYKRNFGAQERFNRNALFKEAKELRHWARDLEYKLLDRLVSNSQIICATLIGASDKSIKDLSFKTCVIDEASQAMEPECWNAIIKAERVILAGDHLQLSPMVKSNEAKALGLNQTLLSRMTDVIQHSYLLDTQYRMNDKILSFSNKMFYNGLLKSAPNNKDWTLPEDDQIVVMIDTSGCGFEESFNAKSRSRYNEGEYYILREHFIQSKKQYEGASIGIISPYSEQVKHLRNHIEDDEMFRGFDVTVNSIDGFQGQEKDVIYISLVRSNNQGEIGFLKDEKRLNVAMTRARKKLIMIGDLSTLSQISLFNNLAKHIEENGTYRSAWEFMNMT